MASYETAVSMSQHWLMTSLKTKQTLRKNLKKKEQAHVQSQTWQRSTKTPQKDFEIREGFSRFQIKGVHSSQPGSNDRLEKCF
jgi:hypothetical protein